MDHGKRVEDLIEELCNRAFLTDFVVRSPMFKKNQNVTREAADFLVPFNDVLLVYQVKTKIESKPATEKSDVDIERIERTINHSIEQLKTIHRAFQAEPNLELINSRGISLPVKRDNFRSLIGIVIIDLVGEEIYTSVDQTRILGAFLSKFDMPIHVFLRSEYQAIVSELDTLPDFIEYLLARQVLFEKSILIPTTDEFDFLAFYKNDREIVEKCLSGECDLIILDDGLWEHYTTERDKLRKLRDQLNEPSYFIDEIINTLHTSIGFTLEHDITIKRNDIGQGTRENYFAAICELSKLNRLSRRTIGERFLDRMEMAEIRGTGYSLVCNQKENSAVLVLSTKRSRRERTTALFNLCAIAYCELGLSKITGIATESLSATGRSYDFIYMDSVAFEKSSESGELFRRSFGERHQYTPTEFGVEDGN